MTGWLLDTNVLSEMRRPRPEPRVTTFIRTQKLDLLYISEVTLAEIRFGIEQIADPAKRADLNDWLSHGLRPMFAGRVLAIHEEVMLRWRLLVEQGRKVGHTFSQPDLIIAASALYYGLTVVSRDTREYEHAGCPVFNPWTDRMPRAD